MKNVTEIIYDVRRGESGASADLFEMLYDELRQLATRKMAQEAPGHTLQATALVNEAYLRLVGSDDVWENRVHFFSVAAEAMRRILIESARRKSRQKRGGGAKRCELSDFDQAILPIADELLDLDIVLDKLEVVDPVKAKLVKLRFFGGLTTKQAAELLGIGLSTAERYWTYARAWLHQEMQITEGNTDDLSHFIREHPNPAKEK